MVINCKLFVDCESKYIHRTLTGSELNNTGYIGTVLWELRQSYTIHSALSEIVSLVYKVVWLVVPVAFQADSDFYVVAELLKDYIGLIQAVKVRNDVLMCAIIQDFNK